MGEIKKYLNAYKKYIGPGIYLLIIFSFLSGLAESFGIVMFLPLFDAIGKISGNLDSADTHFNNVIFEWFDISSLPFLNGSNVVSIMLIIVCAAFVMKGLLFFGVSYYSVYLRGVLASRLRKTLFLSYARFEYEYYISKSSGYFLSMITTEVARTSQSFLYMVQVLNALINSIVCIIVALILAWNFGILALMSGIVVTVLFKSINSKIRALSKKSANENSNLTGLLIHALNGYKYLAATGQFETMSRKLSISVDAVSKFGIQAGSATAILQSIREPLAVLIILTIVYFQVVIFKEQLAPIIVATALFYRGFNSILSVQSKWQSLLENVGSFDDIEREISFQQSNVDQRVKCKISGFRSIEFKNINFHYDSTRPILERLNLTIHANQMVAFVGPSGSGKTTIVDMVALLIYPKSGTLIINGIDSSLVDVRSWRSLIGYVSQDATLFNGTIAENISMWCQDYSDYNERIDKIKSVAKLADISSFIESLPNGYDTNVGDGGVRLSGGQKQRIFIARELYRNPSILILDEATSALDINSEAEIKASIQKLKGSITIIVIAHRLSTIQNSDMVYLIDSGKVIDSGSFNTIGMKLESRIVGCANT